MVEGKNLKKLDVFQAFSKDQLEKLSKITDEKSFKKGAAIYQRGSRADYIYVVLKGMVSLNRLEPGETIGISFEKREKGELFGAACFMQPQQYTLTAVCNENTDVAAINADKLFKLCEQDPEMGYKLLKEVAQIYFERYKAAKRQIHEMVKTPTIITALPG
jgi:CRP-like cAMP-binding protein